VKTTHRPTSTQIAEASKDVAWEYAAMTAAALEMAQDHKAPVNHFVQEAFLLHVRNLAEFFRSGVDDFIKAPSTIVERTEDNIYAVDFCNSMLWSEKPFGKDTRLMKAINKTLSHMTYSRNLTPSGVSEITLAFDGCNHVHGTVNLIRRTWEKFQHSMKPEYMRPQYPTDIAYWLAEHTNGWRVKFSDWDNEFETQAKRWKHWSLNETPDGTI
jgi:hypothetical protein